MPDPYPGVPCYCKECSRPIVGLAAPSPGEWPVAYYHPLHLINRLADREGRGMAIDIVRSLPRVRFERGMVY